MSKEKEKRMEKQGKNSESVLENDLDLCNVLDQKAGNLWYEWYDEKTLQGNWRVSKYK